MPARADTPPRPHAAQLRAVGTAFLRRRPALVAPAFAAQATLLLRCGAPVRQVSVVLGGFSVLLALFVWEAWRGRTRLVTEGALVASLLATLAGITAGSVATGALGSPLVPLVFAPTVVGFAAFGRAPQGRALLAALVVALAVLALVPTGVPFPALPVATSRAMTLVASATTVALLWVGVSSLSDAYARAGDTLAHAGDELLATAEARHRAMEALGAQVAHEIKNPLTAIKGLADLLAERATDDADRRRLDVMSAEVARIEAILRDYLAMSRPLDDFAPSPTALGALVSSLCALLAPRAERLGVTLTAEGDVPDASVDARRVKEAVLNLLLNALDATPAGGAVTVRCVSLDGAASVVVRDTGRGMSPEVLARAGESFYTTRAAGTGLGLHLARRVATEHGGGLDIESAPGAGSTFTLRLGASSARPRGDRLVTP